MEVPVDTMRRLTIALALTLAVTTLASAQVIWRSVASGNWGTLATWQRSTDGGGTWATPTAVPATRDTNSNFIIATGTTVVVEASPKYTNDLIIQAGARLTTNVKQPTTDIRYVRIKGDTLLVDGVLGFAANPADSSDVLSLQVYGPNQTLTIMGSGTINICRIRPHNGVGRTNITTVFDADATITYLGSTGTGGSGIYSANDATNDSITFTFNAGRTITMVDGCNLATTSSTSTDGTASTTFNINGTVNMLGGNLSLRGAAGKSIVLNVAGTLNVGGSVYPTGTTGVTSTINVTGTMNTGTLGGGTLYFDAPAQTVTGSGTFSLGRATLRLGAAAGFDATSNPFQTTTFLFTPAAKFAYVGTVPQTTGSLLPAHISGLTVNNTAGVTLSQDLLVDTTLTLTAGPLYPGGHALVIPSTATVNRTSGYVDGPLVKTGLSGRTAFEVGTAGNYAPVVVTPTAGTGDFTVTAVNGSHPNLVNSALALKRYWTLASAGITQADLTFNYPSADVQGDESLYRAGRHFTGTSWNMLPTTAYPTGDSAVVAGVTAFSDWTLGEQGAFTPFDDPASIAVVNAEGVVTLDGKLDEAEWATAPALLFGYGANLKKGAGEQTVTGFADIKATYDYWDQGTLYGTFHRPNTDSSLAKVRFLRKGMNLYIGVTSNDPSICKFDWEGDGLFLKIKQASGTDLEYKLYYQNIGTAADTIRFEPPPANWGAGAGYLPVGSTVNDTSNLDNGYSVELRIPLDTLGYTRTSTAVQVALAIFDPDGYQHPMNSYDTLAGSFYKSWWGSEWGGVYRTLTLTPEVIKFEDPPAMAVVNVPGAVTLDGKLNEPEWATAPKLAFGNGAFLKKTPEAKTVTGFADIKATYDYWDQGTFYGTFHRPNTDSSLAYVSFIRKGMNLYIGVTSNDPSICKFDWEGDGLFFKAKRANGTDVEYKLYYQNIGTAADTIRYEEQFAGWGAGAGYLPAGSTVNDTSNTDNGYSVELMVRLDSLGFAADYDSLTVAMAIFDPDGYQHPMNSYDTLAGSFYKSWWGSEWGGVYRTLLVTPEPVKFEDPPAMAVVNVPGAVTLDGKLNEPEWATAPKLAFGNGAFLKKSGGAKTVTGEADIKATYDYWDQGTFYGTFHRPNTDSSLAYVSFIRKGMNLYIGVTSNDPSICKFDWEGDGLFFKAKRANGTDVEYKLYYQNIGTAADTIRYEEQFAGWGAGAGFLPAGSTANDTSNTDNGYSVEMMVRIDSLGFAADYDSLTVAMAIFDPDGYQHPMNSYDTLAGSFYKSWWGSEWGGVYRTLLVTPEPVKFQDPDTIAAIAATADITLDGVLSEADWANAATLAFGNGAFLKKPAGAKTVTGEADIKATYDYWDQGTLYGTFHRPNTDSSLTLVKVLRKGANLYFGVTSNDPSICKFDWEGDGIFVKLRRATGGETEFKLYYQNIGTAADTIRYEEQFAGWGAGAGFLPTGSTVNDTSNTDNGYSAELMVRLDSLGYAPSAQGVQLSMAIFDPDGYQHPMNSYDTLAGSYYKSWWGSEWGGVWRVIAFDNLVSVAGEGENGIPDAYALHQNFPNPFNPSTQIRFALPTASTVRIAVYDVTGREVGVPALGDFVAGVHTVTFDARRLASGVYFYRMTAVGKDGASAPFIATNKLVLVK